MSENDAIEFQVLVSGRAEAALAAAQPQLSRRERLALFAGHQVRRGQRKLAKGDDVQAGEMLSVALPETPWFTPQIASDVVALLETDDYIYLNKPAAMACHPLKRGEGGTLLDAAAALCPDVVGRWTAANPREAGLCHRLDTDTSGVVLLAKNLRSHRFARQAFRSGAPDGTTERTRAGMVEKRYLAIVEGRVDVALETTAAIAHHPKDKRKMVPIIGNGASEKGQFVRGKPKSARTVLVPLLSGTRSVVVVLAEGGRRHQVRIHAMHLGHPLAGDVLYGGKNAPPLKGHALHAFSLRFFGQPLVTAPISSAFLQVIGDVEQAPLWNVSAERLAHLASAVAVR